MHGSVIVRFKSDNECNDGNDDNDDDNDDNDDNDGKDGIADYKMSHSCSVYFISWPDWRFEPNRSDPTFPTQKRKSGRRHLYQFQRDTEQLCMHWMGRGGGGPTLGRGKSHIGNFGLATNLSLFFLGHLCILCCVPQKSSFFLAGNEYLGVKKLNSPPATVLLLSQLPRSPFLPPFPLIAATFWMIGVCPHRWLLSVCAIDTVAAAAPTSPIPCRHCCLCFWHSCHCLYVITTAASVSVATTAPLLLFLLPLHRRATAFYSNIIVALVSTTSAITGKKR